MILTLAADKSVTLVQANDFKRFYCEIHIVDATLELAKAALNGILELESRYVSWVDVDALFRLDRDSTSSDWETSALAMIEKARPHGWVRDYPLAVKSHIVWRA